MRFMPVFTRETDALELEYRTHYLTADARQTRVAIAVWMVPVLLFALADYALFGWGGRFAISLVVRLAFCVFSLYIIYALTKVATVREYDRVFIRWAAAGVVAVLYFNYSWVNYVPPNGAITVLVIFSSYMVFPTSLHIRLVPPLVLSVGNVYMQGWVVHPVNLNSLFATAVALLMANVLGIIFSTWLQDHRRTEFKARLEESRIKAVLSRQASVDDLTGVFNRRQLMALAGAEFARFKTYGRPLSVVMIDIDHFKRLNDSFGHEAGDLILTTFTACAGKCLREGDILGRLGGDEFVLVLPGTTGEQAMVAAERVRLCMDDPVVWQGDPLAVTVSVGVSEAREKDGSIDHVLKRADKALYMAKRKGRNRTEAM